MCENWVHKDNTRATEHADKESLQHGQEQLCMSKPEGLEHRPVYNILQHTLSLAQMLTYSFIFFF